MLHEYTGWGEIPGASGGGSIIPVEINKQSVEWNVGESNYEVLVFKKLDFEQSSDKN